MAGKSAPCFCVVLAIMTACVSGHESDSAIVDASRRQNKKNKNVDATGTAQAWDTRFSETAKLGELPPYYMILFQGFMKPLLLILAFGFAMAVMIMPGEETERSREVYEPLNQAAANSSSHSAALPAQTTFVGGFIGQWCPAPAKLLTNFMMLAALVSDALKVCMAFKENVELPRPIRFVTALSYLSASGNIAGTLTAVGFYVLHRGDMNCPTIDGRSGNNSPWPTLIVPNLDELLLRGNPKAWRWVAMDREVLSTFDKSTQFYMYVLVYVYRPVFTVFMLFIFPAGIMYFWVAFPLFALIFVADMMSSTILPVILRIRIRCLSSQKEIQGIVTRMEMSPEDAAASQNWPDPRTYGQDYLLEIFGPATVFEDVQRSDLKRARETILKAMPSLPPYGMLARVTGANGEIWRDYFSYSVCGGIAFAVFVPLASHLYVNLWAVFQASSFMEAAKALLHAYGLALWETFTERTAITYFGQFYDSATSASMKGLKIVNAVWLFL